MLDWVILAGLGGLAFSKRSALKARFKEYVSGSRDAWKERQTLIQEEEQRYYENGLLTFFPGKSLEEIDATMRDEFQNHVEARLIQLRADEALSHAAESERLAREAVRSASIQASYWRSKSRQAAF